MTDEEILEEAHSLLQAKKYEEAKKLLVNMRDKHNNSKTFALLGHAELMLGNYFSSIKKFNAANKIEETAFAYIGLGDAELYLNESFNEEKARNYYLTAIRIEPKNSICYSKLANLYIYLQNWNNAEINLLKATDLNKDEIKNWLDLLYVQSLNYKWNEAEQSLNMAKALFKEDPDILYFEILIKGLLDKTNEYSNLKKEYLNKLGDEKYKELEEKLKKWGLVNESEKTR